MVALDTSVVVLETYFIYEAVGGHPLQTHQQYVWAQHQEPRCQIGIHVFLVHSHKSMNNVFRLVNPVLDRSSYIFKGSVFLNQAKYE